MTSQSLDDNITDSAEDMESADSAEDEEAAALLLGMGHLSDPQPPRGRSGSPRLVDRTSVFSGFRCSSCKQPAVLRGEKRPTFFCASCPSKGGAQKRAQRALHGTEDRMLSVSEATEILHGKFGKPQPASLPASPTTLQAQAQVRQLSWHCEDACMPRPSLTQSSIWDRLDVLAPARPSYLCRSCGCGCCMFWHTHTGQTWQWSSRCPGMCRRSSGCALQSFRLSSLRSSTMLSASTAASQFLCSPRAQILSGCLQPTSAEHPVRAARPIRAAASVVSPHLPCLAASTSSPSVSVSASSGPDNCLYYVQSLLQYPSNKRHAGEVQALPSMQHAIDLL